MPKNCSNNDLRNVQLNIKGYNCLSNHLGRGVCMYINNDFEILERLSNVESLFTPSIFCKIKCKEDIIVLGVVYRSPNSTPEDNDKLNTQIDFISNMLNASGERLVMVGDFNYPDINWDQVTCDKSSNHPAFKFLNTVNSNYFTQYVDRPTHFRALQEPTLIDLVLSNFPDFIHSLEFMPPFGKSHHSVICFDFDIKSPTDIKPVKKFSYNKGDYDGMRCHFSGTDWETMLDGDVDEAWSRFESEIKVAMNKYIPMFTKNKVNKHSYEVPSTTLSLIQRKRAAFKHYKQFPSHVNYNTYAKYRNQVKWECKKAKMNKEKKVASLSKLNPKAFYQYINNKLKTSENVSSLIKSDGTLTTNDLEKAEVLNDFFSSVFTTEDVSNIPVFNSKSDVFIDKINVSIKEMEDALRSLNVNKSSGPDGLHPRVLKELATVLSYPLKLLFDKTITQGKLPSQWKIAEVRPIFKKGIKTSPGNYRPVSLTPIICKVFEGFIKDSIFKHLIHNNLLSDDQYGFCGGRSCTTQLLNTINDWFSYLDKNIPVDAVYLDFRKAFDTVPHERLLNKLHGYGVRGQLLDWIRDFLKDRSQYVTINDKSSSKIPVTSGVPQGSVLGPTLFIYFINDLPSLITIFIKIFADDTKAYLPILSDADRIILQKTIDDMVHWSKIWQLHFNGSKCKVLHLGRNNPCYKYTIEDDNVIKDLEVTVLEKDLGVHVDPLLSFENHISITVKKVRSLSGLIIRSFSFKTIDIMLPIYISKVRLILEYANVVWMPYKRKHIDLIESVQRHFTRYIIGMKEMRYEDRLKSLKLYSLEYRRFRGDMIEVFKMCHGHYDPITTKTLLTYNNKSNTRTNDFKLLKNRVNSTQFLNFFTNRVINPWNKLPREAVNAGSINAFKKHIDYIYREHLYSTNFEIV